MAGREHVQALMREIGPQSGLLEVTEFADLDAWTLVVDEATVLFADYDDSRPRLMLSAEVGEPAETARLRLYELMLRYNDAWRETGGGRMALDPAGGVVLGLELSVEGLELARLRAVIGGFVEVLQGWRDIVAKARGDETVTVPPEVMMPAGIIRG